MNLLCLYGITFHQHVIQLLVGILFQRWITGRLILFFIEGIIIQTCFQIKARSPADNHIFFTVFNQISCHGLKISCTVGCFRRENINQMMHNSMRLLHCDFSTADIQSSVYLNGISTDHFKIEPFRNRYRKIGFTDRCRPGNNKYFFHKENPFISCTSSII